MLHRANGPRVAFFPDSYHEVNGVAHTARQFTAWAAQQDLPFLCVRAGESTLQSQLEGTQQVLELPRGVAAFALDKDLSYDPLFARHTFTILKALRAFRPDIVHITGPSELGMLGAAAAHHLEIPLVASWHTNVHEYLARRSEWALKMLPVRQQPGAADMVERATLRSTALFYRSARALFAPNAGLCELLEKETGRPCSVMPRGVDATLFSPTRRTRPPAGPASGYTLGYVGRLSIEKNVALLPRIAEALRGRVDGPVRWLIIGQGVEDAALRAAMPDAEFAGVLRGEALAEAYAEMDCFVFPSHTDTFGNVVLEAFASGVPVIVTPDGGPASLAVVSGAGIVATDDCFAPEIESLLADKPRHAAMCERARAYALGASWDAVFKGVYGVYETVLRGGEATEEPALDAS